MVYLLILIFLYFWLSGSFTMLLTYTCIKDSAFLTWSGSGTDLKASYNINISKENGQWRFITRNKRWNRADKKCKNLPKQSPLLSLCWLDQRQSNIVKACALSEVKQKREKCWRKKVLNIVSEEKVWGFSLQNGMNIVYTCASSVVYLAQVNSAAYWQMVWKT